MSSPYLLAYQRRKHSELVGEVSNLHKKEEKLLSEVCILVLPDIS